MWVAVRPASLAMPARDGRARADLSVSAARRHLHTYCRQVLCCSMAASSWRWSRRGYARRAPPTCICRTCARPRRLDVGRGRLAYSFTISAQLTAVICLALSAVNGRLVTNVDAELVGLHRCQDDRCVCGYVEIGVEVGNNLGRKNGCGALMHRPTSIKGDSRISGARIFHQRGTYMVCWSW